MPTLLKLEIGSKNIEGSLIESVKRRVVDKFSIINSTDVINQIQKRKNWLPIIFVSILLIIFIVYVLVAYFFKKNDSKKRKSFQDSQLNNVSLSDGISSGKDLEESIGLKI